MNVTDDDGPDDDSDDSAPAATERLREVLSARGVRCEESEGWLHLRADGPSTGLRARAHTYVVQAYLGGCSIQLDVELLPWEGRLVIESCGGFGATFEEAQNEAFARFDEGMLPVLLAAFLRPPDAEVRVEQWEISGVRRQVLIGKIQERGEPSSEATLRAWLGAVERAIQGMALPTGTHWVRVFHAHQPNHPRTLEVLLDTTPCAELGAVLEQAPWPTGPGFTSQRVFLVIQGGVDVSRAVASFIAHARDDASSIVREIMAAGATPLEAEKLLYFLPQAFAQTVFAAELPFADTMNFISPRQRCMWTLSLPREPLWREALQRAKQNHSGEPQLTEEQVGALLCRFPGLGGFLESMQSPDPGRRIKEVAPLLVTLTDAAAEQLGAEQPAKPIPEQLAPFVDMLTGGRPGAPQSRGDRPWWKFW